MSVGSLTKGWRKSKLTKSVTQDLEARDSQRQGLVLSQEDERTPHPQPFYTRYGDGMEENTVYGLSYKRENMLLRAWSLKQ